MIIKEIDTENWNRKKQYDWLKNFSNPNYNLNVRIDVTKVVEFSKRTKSSFFINFMFLVAKGMSAIEEFRTRIVDNKVVVFDKINPTYTVMTECGVFENCKHEMSDDYKVFYSRASEVIEKAKKLTKISDAYNSETRFDEYYMTCLPWLDFTAMTHPIPDEVSSINVPRVCWGKYTLENEKYSLTLNINVSHTLVDGYPASRAFLNIQNLCDNCEKEFV